MLEKMLQDMITDVRESPAFVHQPLKGGLHIYLRKEDDGFHLVLMRKETYPSLQEWNTVLSNWPWRVIKNPDKSNDGKFNYLTGIIPDRKA